MMKLQSFVASIINVQVCSYFNNNAHCSASMYLQALRISIHLSPGGHCPTSGKVMQMGMIGGIGPKKMKHGFKHTRVDLCKVTSSLSSRSIGEINSKGLQLGDAQLIGIRMPQMHSLSELRASSLSAGLIAR